MTGDERSVAQWLVSLDDDELSATFTARSISPSVPWHDFFDAAEALLDPASIDRALTRQDREGLRALQARSVPARATLVRHALQRPDGSVPAAVTTRVDAAHATHPDAFAPLAPAPISVTADPAETAAAAERVFTAAAELADILLGALHSPLDRTGAGALTAAERKRLVTVGAASDAHTISALLDAARAAGLLRALEREFAVTETGEEWLTADTVTRWRIVAEGLRASLPEPLRTPAGGFTTPTQWRFAVPLDPTWPEYTESARALAVRWGVITPTGELLPWSAPLAAGDPPDEPELRAALPTEIDRIYLQADLTAIAPGPLAPSLDQRLRLFARRESRAQASTYRFTAETITAGLTEGETADTIRAFLTELSLTGIPQPLAYLIETTASRHGSVTVRTDPATGFSLVDSTDAAVLELVAVDQALRPLGLVRTGAGLTGRVGRDAVFWSLADARYPVVALNAAGEQESLRRRTAPRESGEPGAASRYAPLIARLRSGASGDTDAAWLGRELEQAVRARSVIAVTVRLNQTEQREFVLEATGLGGGRLRGRDRAADVERSLPVSSIVGVRSA